MLACLAVASGYPLVVAAPWLSAFVFGISFLGVITALTDVFRKLLRQAVGRGRWVCRRLVLRGASGGAEFERFGGRPAGGAGRRDRAVDGVAAAGAGGRRRGRAQVEEKRCNGEESLIALARAGVIRWRKRF